jgi:predicted DNA-binding transcriptional regulator AlpA
MKTEFLLLTLYEKPFLSFQETCEAIGISLQSGYNSRSQKTFPIPMLEKPLRASIQDIAQYIDEQREQAKEKIGHE